MVTETKPQIYPCSKCGCLTPWDFILGESPLCKECFDKVVDAWDPKVAYRRKYNAEHREQKAAYMRKYYAEHREQKAAYMRKYYAEHREQKGKHVPG